MAIRFSIHVGFQGLHIFPAVSVQSALSRFKSTMRVLCVAEKPSIAKAVANHLSGGEVQTVRLAIFVIEASTSLMLYIAQHPGKIHQELRF